MSGWDEGVVMASSKISKCPNRVENWYKNGISIRRLQGGRGEGVVETSSKILK